MGKGIQDISIFRKLFILFFFTVMILFRTFFHKTLLSVRSTKKPSNKGRLDRGTTLIPENSGSFPICQWAVSLTGSASGTSYCQFRRLLQEDFGWKSACRLTPGSGSLVRFRNFRLLILVIESIPWLYSISAGCQLFCGRSTKYRSWFTVNQSELRFVSCFFAEIVLIL